MPRSTPPLSISSLGLLTIHLTGISRYVLLRWEAVDAWLIIDDRQELVPAIRTELASLGAEVELHTAADADPALRSLASSPVRRLVMRAENESVDCLDLVCRALRTTPQLEVIICSKRFDVIDGPTSLATGVCFVGDPREAAAVESPGVQRSPRNDGRPLTRPDIVDVVRMVSQSGQTRVLEVSSSTGRGALGFTKGSLTHASTGNLTGSEAFFQMVLWEESTFEGVESNAYLERDANISTPTNELLRETVYFRIALERDVLELPQSPEGASDGRGCLGVAQWWEMATEEKRSIVRVLVGYSPKTSCGCVRAFTEEFADHLKPVKRWISEPKIGPTFVRLHNEDESILNLTFIAMIPGNRFLFETFARSSEAVVICRSGDDSDPETWRDWVPEGIRVVTSEEYITGNGESCPALRRLVEDEG